MSLKNKILLDKFLIPIIVLIVFIIYLFKQNPYFLKYEYEIFILDFIIWLVFSVIFVFRSTNHLINYSIDSEFIKLEYYINLTTKKKIIIPANGIKNTKLRIRLFNFGFDILSIKYVDNKGLYNLINLRVSNKKDWIAILSKIESETT